MVRQAVDNLESSLPPKIFSLLVTSRLLFKHSDLIPGDLGQFLCMSILVISDLDISCTMQIFLFCVLQSPVTLKWMFYVPK